MPHVGLEGETLGERHRYYNKVVEETVTGTDILMPIDYNENDIDNLLKIDVASKRRDVAYILEVLKCDDMLYVSRALKQSTWLITEQQYAHIINPSYLHRHLFPHMNTKAINKLTLQIRNKLKDDRRIKAFYYYHLKVNSKTALKWLQNCPVPFILRAVKRHGRDIPIPILKRLCRKSPHALSIYLDRYQTDRQEVLSAVTFLAKNKTDVYLDVVYSTWTYYLNSFGAKATGYFLKKCPDRILDHFEHYAANIHLPTFVKYIKRTGVKEFLLKEAGKGQPEWFNFSTLKDFLKEIPRDEIFDLLKILFRIDNEEIKISELLYAIEKKDKMVAADVYRWYEFAPFNIARHEIQKLIYAESSPEERQSMLSVLLACADSNLEHIRATLQYYHDKHINEPYKFKIPFVYDILDKTSYHKFDDDTWNLLNDLFHSMEVYIESENEVKYCMDSIIIYKVVHDQDVPEIIETKFQYGSLKYYQSKLNEEEKEKIFKYLYDYLSRHSFREKITNETELNENVSYLERTWTLIKDWKKEQQYYQTIIDKIIKLQDVKKTVSSDVNLSQLYRMMGRWRRVLFSASLSLCASEETCLNALKHEPRLLVRHSAELHTLRAVNTTAPRRLLSKLRLYWPHTIAKEWTDEYFACIMKTSKHNALIQGLYILVPSEKLIDFIKTHAPGKKQSESKEDDEVELSLRKHMAMNMHLVRPPLSIDIVLDYAKGRCLKYTEPSLNIICSNQNSATFEQHVQKILKAPVSLQKHGIRLAFRKLKAHQLKTIISEVWESTKNVTIREMIFTMTFQLLCKEKKMDLIKELWKVLSHFIDQLTPDENRDIYQPLVQIKSVPSCVRPDFYVKCYNFLKTLSEKTGSGFLISRLLYYSIGIIQDLDPDFVMNVLLESSRDNFFYCDYTHKEMLAVFILCSENEKVHAERCEQLLEPLLKRCLDYSNPDIYFRIEDFLVSLVRQMPNIVFNRKILPVQAFTKIPELLEKILTVEENYMRITSWKLIVNLTKVLEELSKANQSNYSWHEMLFKSLPYFGNICKKQLQEDMDKYFPSIYLIFGDALTKFRRMLQLDDMFIMQLIETILDDNIIQTYLLGLQILPSSMWDDETRKQEDIRRRIFLHGSSEVKMHYLSRFSELS